MDQFDIDRIKNNGAIQALKKAISDNMSIIRTSNWNNVEYAGNFVKLQVAISNAEDILKDMRALLNSLQELEPVNK